MSDDKVHIKLEKKYLESEKREIRNNFVRKLLIFFLCFLFLIIGIVVGMLINGKKVDTVSGKLEEIKTYIKSNWLYSNDYENLDEHLNDKAFYGMTDFDDDPYTSYLSREELDEFASNINMDYIGIGVQYRNIDNVATIIRVFKNSPAEKYGLEVGDIIKSIDEKDIFGFDNEQIRELVLGPEGSFVKIGVNREGEELEFEIKRETIETTAFAYAKNDYVILELMSFGQSTSRECINYLDDFTNYEKLIIDLRGNTGGYQNSVQEVAGLFLGKDQVVMDQIYNSGKRTTFKTMSAKHYDNFKKIVILIDEGTASASEVLTMCLKELHPDVTTVGETTYGKGVVQSNYILSDNSALKMTTSKWLSPKGVWINGEGIDPDYEVFQDDYYYYEGQGMEIDDVYKYDDVKDVISFVQMSLDFLDYEVAREDGYFDESLVDALSKFQTEFNLEVTGNLDYKTFETIISIVNRVVAEDDTKDKQLVKAVELLQQ